MSLAVTDRCAAAFQSRCPAGAWQVAGSSIPCLFAGVVTPVLTYLRALHMGHACNQGQALQGWQACPLEVLCFLAGRLPSHAAGGPCHVLSVSSGVHPIL